MKCTLQITQDGWHGKWHYQLMMGKGYIANYHDCSYETMGQANRAAKLCANRLGLAIQYRKEMMRLAKKKKGGKGCK